MSRKKRILQPTTAVVIPVETRWPHLREPDRRVILMPVPRKKKGGREGA